MSIGTSLARGSATVAVFAVDKGIRLGNAVASNTGDFFTTFQADFAAKNEVAAARRVVDFTAANAYRAQLRAEINAAREAAPEQVLSSPIRAKAAKA